MSCCGGKCGCGAGCGCGSACTGCKEMMPWTSAMILGFQTAKPSFGGFEMAEGAESGCKCRANCTCNPCTSK